MTSEAPSLPQETPGSTLPGVFGVGVGLLLIVGCVAVVVLFGWRTAPAAAALGERYDVGELPFGFELHDDAFLLPGGERVFVLRPPASPPPTADDVARGVDAARGGAQGAASGGDAPGDAAEGSELPDAPGGSAGADGVDPATDEPTDEPADEARDEAADDAAVAAVDWAALAPETTGAPPAELFLVHYPLGPGAAVIEAQFRSLNWRDLSLIEAEGGSTPVEGGRVEWAGYAADFVRVRRFSPGPTFRDVLRVNLSVGQECWIAYAVWPPLSEGSTEPVRALLDALRLRAD